MSRPVIAKDIRVGDRIFDGDRYAEVIAIEEGERVIRQARIIVTIMRHTGERRTLTYAPNYPTAVDRKGDS
jgi:hypothetical protein